MYLHVVYWRVRFASVYFRTVPVSSFSELASCRPGCGACCIAPSISSAIPGMPNGKPAGVRCVQLDENNGCKIFGQPGRPRVCASLPPSREMCGDSNQHAMFFLAELERLTA
jgi:Fe-S-cluster containining protein